MRQIFTTVAQPVELAVPVAQRLQYYSGDPHCPSLEDLAEMLPHQIRLPQPTLLCKATTERERREEITSRGPHPGGAVVVDSEVIEMHLRVHLRDFQGTSTAHLERGLIFALKRGIDDAVADRGNNLSTNSNGSLTLVASILILFLGVAVFLILPLGGLVLILGAVVLVWCHSHATDETRRSADAISRSCCDLVAQERDEADEEQGQVERQEGGGGGGGAGRSRAAGGGAEGGRATATVAMEEDAGFDFFLNGWCSCCSGDPRRAALVSIKPSKELRAVRLIQLLKFADPRASAYLGDPAGQDLLSSIEFRPQVVRVHASLARPCRPIPPATAVAVPAVLAV